MSRIATRVNSSRHPRFGSQLWFSSLGTSAASRRNTGVPAASGDVVNRPWPAMRDGPRTVPAGADSACGTAPAPPAGQVVGDDEFAESTALRLEHPSAVAPPDLLHEFDE